MLLNFLSAIFVKFTNFDQLENVYKDYALMGGLVAVQDIGYWMSYHERKYLKIETDIFARDFAYNYLKEKAKAERTDTPFERN